jgi:hypothetical protein
MTRILGLLPLAFIIHFRSEIGSTELEATRCLKALTSRFAVGRRADPIPEKLERSTDNDERLKARNWKFVLEDE